MLQKFSFSTGYNVDYHIHYNMPIFCLCIDGSYKATTLQGENVCNIYDKIQILN